MIPALALPPQPAASLPMKEKLRIWYEKYFDAEGFCEYLQLVYSPVINMPSAAPLKMVETLKEEVKLLQSARATMLWKRELAFYWTDDKEATLMRRFKSTVSPLDLRSQLVQLIPERVEYGPVYTSSPGNAITAFVNVPQLAEIKFDIDITDYERPCCAPTVKAACWLCWIQIRAAIRTIMLVMKKVFDANDPCIVYSGLKGAHVVYSGYSLSSVDVVAREQIANVFIKDLSKSLSDRNQQELLSECFSIWREEFFNLNSHLRLRSCTDWIAIMKAQYPHFAKVLDHDLPLGPCNTADTARNATSNFLGTSNRKSIATATGTIRRQGQGIWKQLTQAQHKNTSTLMYTEHVADPRLSGSPTTISSDPGAMKKTKVETKEAVVTGTLSDLIVTMFAPRIDEGVLMEIGHLIKAWDCIHPVSKKRCVRIPMELLMSFNPETVPTLDQILDNPELYASKPDSK